VQNGGHGDRGPPALRCAVFSICSIRAERICSRTHALQHRPAKYRVDHATRRTFCPHPVVGDRPARGYGQRPHAQWTATLMGNSPGSEEHSGTEEMMRFVARNCLSFPFAAVSFCATQPEESDGRMIEKSEGSPDRRQPRVVGSKRATNAAKGATSLVSMATAPDRRPVTIFPMLVLCFRVAASSGIAGATRAFHSEGPQTSGRFRCENPRRIARAVGAEKRWRWRGASELESNDVCLERTRGGGRCALLGKPSDAADAARYVRMLSGRTHRVITGVCLVAGAWRGCPARLRL